MSRSGASGGRVGASRLIPGPGGAVFYVSGVLLFLRAGPLDVFAPSYKLGIDGAGVSFLFFSGSLPSSGRAVVVGFFELPPRPPLAVPLLFLTRPPGASNGVFFGMQPLLFPILILKVSPISRLIPFIRVVFVGVGIVLTSIARLLIRLVCEFDGF